MLILAGITLKFVWGDGGIVQKAERARIQHLIGEEKDILSLSHSALYIDNKAFGESYKTENMQDEIQKHGKKNIVNWKIPDKIMRVRFEESKNVYTIDIETGEIKLEGGYDPAIETPELKTSDLEFIHNPADWTNGNTKVTIQKTPNSNINLDELTIQYSIGNLDNFTNYTEPIEMTQNGMIYVRLIYELIGEASGYISNEETKIDKLDPTGNIESESTSNSITVKVDAEDAQATKEYGCSDIKGYYYSKDDGVTYTELTTDAEYTFNELTQNTDYKIKVKIEDNAGNILEISKNEKTKNVTGLTEANTKIIVNPSTATKNNVTVTITTDVTGYTLQYKTEKTGKTGEVSNWTNYTGPITLERNQKVYAQAVDSTNQAGTFLSADVVNIDKLEPNGSLSITDKTSSTATLKVAADDATATSDYAKSGIKGYYYSKDDGATYTAITTQTTYKFTGLTQGKEYPFKVKIEDNAGNTKEVGSKGSTDLITGTITFGTPSWSGTNATMSISGAQTGCELQYRIGANGTWTTITSGSNIPAVASGTVVYGRLFDGTNQSNLASTTPLWTGTISYNANGGTGSVPSAHNVQHTKTATVSFSATPSKTGYTFAGWNTNAAGTGTNYTSNGTKTFTMGTSNVTLYAKWTANQYTISYNANGGSVSPTSTTANYGASMTMPTPTKTGYTFAGWYTATSGGTKRTYTTMPAYNETVYAQWTANQYTVTYNANGGTGGPSAVTQNYGTTVTVGFVPTPTRYNYTFAGWSTSSTATSATYTSSGTKTFTLTGNVTLYAVWKINTYTVTYNVNGGTGSVPSAVTQNYNTTVNVSFSPIPTKSGCEFLGWATTSTATSAAYTSSGTKTFTLKGNVTLYAVWRKETGGIPLEGAESRMVMGSVQDTF